MIILFSIMNFVVWNVRGVGKGEKCLIIKNLVGKYKIGFLGLIETKHRQTIRNRLKRMWGSDDFVFCESFASETHAGGIVTVWDHSKFVVFTKHVGERWILLEGLIMGVNLDCCVGVVYGPNDRIERRLFFENLKNVIQSINKPLLLLGDFNVVLFPFEKVGVFNDVGSMRDFSDWINDLDLLDLPLHGINYTWRRNESKSKLDRGLCSDDWMRVFPNLRLIGLNRSSSDHNPIALLSDTIINWGPKPFRCFDAWFLNPEFKKFVRREWTNLPHLPINNKLKCNHGIIILTYICHVPN